MLVFSFVSRRKNVLNHDIIYSTDSILGEGKYRPSRKINPMARMCMYVYSLNIFYCSNNSNGVGLQVLTTLVTALPLMYIIMYDVCMHI